MKINGLDLFSGIGGIALALAPWVETKGYCDIEPYCQKLLTQHMGDGLLDTAPIYTDVTKLRGEDIGDTIDIISGGFPCQDISVAGHGAGLAGERSGLFFEIVRLACELRPTFIFLENVPAITTRGGCAVVAELTKIGYECRWTTLSAQAVGANHKRERWWLLARLHPSHARCEQARPDEGIRPESGKSGLQDFAELCTQLPTAQYLADTDSAGCQELNTPPEPERQRHDTRGFASIWSSEWWTVEPSILRVAHGIPARVDRIKALGNSVVPLQARTAFDYLLNGKQS